MPGLPDLPEAPRCATDDTVLALTRSWALYAAPGARRLSLDVAFDGPPPDAAWRVHQAEFACPVCGAARVVHAE